MSFTIWSLIIPVAIYYFFTSYRKLFYLLVIFSFFPAAAILNLGDFGLQIPHFVAILLIARGTLNLLYTIKYKDIVEIVKPNICLVLYLFVIVISMMIAYSRGLSDVTVYGIGNNVQLQVLRFNSQNITQFMYAVMNLFIYYIAKVEMVKNDGELKKVIKIMVIAQLVLTSFAVIQIICNNMNLPYHQWFRTMPSLTERKRIYSITAEPSIFGQVSVIMLSVLASVNIFTTKKRNFYALIFILFMGLLSRSTTFYLSAVVLVIATIFEDRITDKVKHIIYLIIFGLVAYSAINHFVPDFWSTLLTDSTEKFGGENTSGRVRSAVAEHMFGVGLKFPIFGIGVGSGRSNDLFTQTFATTGILGFVFFFTPFINGLITGIKGFWKDKGKDVYYEIPKKDWCKLLINLIIVYFATGISCPDFYFYTYLAIMLAIIDVVTVKVAKQEREKDEASEEIH